MARMARPSRPLVGLLLALVCVVAPVGIGPSTPADATAAVPAWQGGIDLYRRGTFTTQKSWLWCTAADVQIIRNIARRQADHSTAGQRRYFAWMRLHNRYRLPLSAGVDPAGWTAGLRHFVDDRYRLVASTSFAAALRSAVTNLRRTNLPVGLTVAHGGHAWILTGFTATADPLVTTAFTVTSVRVVGPLYGLQSRNGYDMRPDTKLTPAQLRRFFTPWRYAPKRMIWDGRYVTIQPIPTISTLPIPIPTIPIPIPIPTLPTTTAAAAAAPMITPKPAGTRTTPAPEVSPSPVLSPPAATQEPTPTSQASQDVAIVAPPASTGSGGAGIAVTLAVIAVGLAAALMAIGIGRSVARARAGPRLRPGR